MRSKQLWSVREWVVFIFTVCAFILLMNSARWFLIFMFIIVVPVLLAEAFSNSNIVIRLLLIIIANAFIGTVDYLVVGMSKSFFSLCYSVCHVFILFIVATFIVLFIKDFGSIYDNK